MLKRSRFLSILLALAGAVALAQPLALLAQAQPTPTLPATPAATPTPDPAAPPVPRVHAVQDGENLTSIAADYGVTVEDILAINNLANGDLLQVGQELIIPGGTGEAIATVYTIAAGDTLVGVADNFNTTLADLMATNRLIAGDLPLIVGQTVPVISRTGSASPRPLTGWPYLVVASDSLLSVAAAHNLTPAALRAANHLTSDYLFPGQRLRLPDDTTTYRHLPQGWVDVRVTPASVGQGSTVSVYVANVLPGTPAGRLGDQPLPFAPFGDGYAALVGIDACAEPGLYDLEISGGDEHGLWQPLRMRLLVTATAYDTQYITLGEALDGLLDPVVRATEDAFLSDFYAVFDETQRWEGVFQYPVTTTILSAGYGGRRSYNNGPIEIYHTGLDIAAAQGDTVSAPANGIVVFSDQLELRGGTIILNHGRGVMTGYYHLSERLVNVGDEVTVGQPIARVGSTGLSSGAHLHWDLRIMNVPVDPLAWTQQTFP